MTDADQERPGGLAGLRKLAQRKKRSWVVRSAVERVDGPALDAYVSGLGEDAAAVRRLEAAVEATVPTVLALSTLTSPLALDYLDRLARPIPALTAMAGVQIVTRSYVAHLVTEGDPGAFGAVDVPVLGTLPPLKRGSPPQDLLSRVVKASRGNFTVIRALSAPVWDGFVRGLARRVHDQVPDPGENGLLAIEVVDGLARFGWVLRQVDLHYRLEPERGSR